MDGVVVMFAHDSRRERTYTQLLTRGQHVFDTAANIQTDPPGADRAESAIYDCLVRETYESSV